MKIRKVHFREAAYIGNTAEQAIPPLSDSSNPELLKRWVIDEQANGDVNVAFTDPGGMVHRSRIPAANVRDIQYEPEPGARPGVAKAKGAVA